MNDKQLKEIQERHNADILNKWSHTVGGRQLHNHNDRGELLRMVAELEADYGRLQNDNQKLIDKRIAAEAVLADVRKLVDTMPITSHGARAIVYRVNEIIKRDE